MNRKKIELQVLNITNSQEQAGAYALVLGEINGERQLPIIIGTNEAQYLLIEMRGINPPRPLTHNLFASVLETLNVSLVRTLIYHVNNGIFFSYIYLKTNNSIIRIDARTSDAIALALRMDAPIFVYDDILERECIRSDYFSDTHDKEQSIREDSLEALKEALAEAVENENYERAAQLRDLINQFKKS